LNIKNILKVLGLLGIFMYLLEDEEDEKPKKKKQKVQRKNMSKTYRLFISHSWTYGDAYDKVVKMISKRGVFL